MKSIKNEGPIERIIQLTISAGAFLVGFFWASENWQIFLFTFSFLVAVFASISFCPLYAIFGKKK